MTALVVGGVIMTVAVLLAATSGFGLGLVATPLLLLCGLSPSFVITVVLLVAIATRLTVAWRLRQVINRRRVVLLTCGAAPGLWIGSRTLGALDPHNVKLVVGVVITTSAVALAWADRRHPRSPGPGRDLDLVAGFLGGLLGTTTSLIGVPPALLLARRRLAAPSFIGDLAVYFIATSALGLVVLALDGNFDVDAMRAFVFWLPAALLANVLGTSLGLRAPEQVFRRLTLGLGFVAGLITIAAA